MSEYVISSLEEFMAFNPEKEATVSEPHTVSVTCDLDFNGANISYATLSNTRKYIDWDFCGHIVKNINYSGNTRGWFFIRAHSVSNVTFENLTIKPLLANTTGSADAGLDVYNWIALFFVPSVSTQSTACKFDNIRINNSCKLIKFDGISPYSPYVHYRLCSIRAEITGDLIFPVSYTSDSTKTTYATMCSSACLVGGNVKIFSSTTGVKSISCYKCFSANKFVNEDSDDIFEEKEGNILLTSLSDINRHNYYFYSADCSFCYVADYNMLNGDWCDVYGSGRCNYCANTVPRYYASGNYWSESSFTRINDITGELSGFDILNSNAQEDIIYLTERSDKWSQKPVIYVYGRYAGRLNHIQGLTVKFPKNSSNVTKVATVTFKIDGEVISQHTYDRPAGAGESYTYLSFTIPSGFGVISKDLSATNSKRVTYSLVCDECSIEICSTKSDAFAKHFFVTCGDYSLPACTLCYEIDNRSKARQYMWTQNFDEFAHLGDNKLFWCILPNSVNLGDDDLGDNNLIWGIGQLPFCTESGVAVRGSNIHGHIAQMLYPKLFKTFILSLALNSVKVERKEE